MGKFPEADLEIAQTQICLRCKTRNKKSVKQCRSCGSKYLRPKRKEIRSKK
ncbi:MAG: 50S ribosomal protein L40e [Candidatus Micrarchaeota archaeon]|nr:50S ribosomal protein L40e [Candidatus Micrarchaeota archaeon]MBU1681256.1 50S ribosomal protein L40e [Candidatus Micrarchaeota archaeon]